MLPGLSNLSAEGVISRLSLLKAHNARGAHIYIRPAGEHRFSVLDDLNSDSVAQLTGDGLEPCAVIETIRRNPSAIPSPCSRSPYSRRQHQLWRTANSRQS